MARRPEPQQTQRPALHKFAKAALTFSRIVLAYAATWARKLTFASLLIIVLALTLPYQFETHGHWENVIWIPFSKLNSRLDFVLNVLLFVPFGCFATLCHRKRGWVTVVATTLVGAGISFAGELGQVYIHFRSPSATDIVLNSIGTFFGASLALISTTTFAQTAFARTDDASKREYRLQS